MDALIMAKSTIQESAQAVRSHIPTDSQKQTLVSIHASKAFSNRLYSSNLNLFATLAQRPAKVAMLLRLIALVVINRAI